MNIYDGDVETRRKATPQSKSKPQHRGHRGKTEDTEDCTVRKTKTQGQEEKSSNFAHHQLSIYLRLSAESAVKSVVLFVSPRLSGEGRA
jgi:hypothetical protein